ncbi:Vacuolar protein-sorting-associated protein 25 [Escovopsis weberi]|uniref:Vacuolar protein-sorting-associated protein 25 n=1 Tax=Escovopsis weberi TaxID=150374 RepID=A0A0M9VSB2_ESCWE|nr:Vacuolar protein-sorting-associated protein 25 [Escovopsis weberi]
MAAQATSKLTAAAAATTTTTTTTTPAPFPFPREYSFPAFFTRQPNLATHHAQLAKWTALVLAYARHHALFRLSLAAAAESELFHNRAIARRLQPPDIRELFDHMVREQRAEFVNASSFFSSSSSSMPGFGDGPGAALFGGGGGGGGAKMGDLVLVYWRTLEEWADGIEEWVAETGQRGAVLTVWEMMNGENTRRAEFHGLDREILLKALNILVKRGRAQIFGAEDSLGVKFF